MDVTIARGTTRAPRIGRVGHVEVDQTTAAGEVASHSDGFVATNGANSNGVVEFLVDNDCCDDQLVLPLKDE